MKNQNQNNFLTPEQPQALIQIDGKEYFNLHKKLHSLNCFIYIDEKHQSFLEFQCKQKGDSLYRYQIRPNKKVKIPIMHIKQDLKNPDDTQILPPLNIKTTLSSNLDLKRKQVGEIEEKDLESESSSSYVISSEEDNEGRGKKETNRKGTTVNYPIPDDPDERKYLVDQIVNLIRISDKGLTKKEIETSLKVNQTLLKQTLEQYTERSSEKGRSGYVYKIKLSK